MTTLLLNDQMQEHMNEETRFFIADGDANSWYFNLRGGYSHRGFASLIPWV
jgi:hypothetical protein